MVWVEIWERSYNSKYDYVESNLTNRFNEKFINVVDFLKDCHTRIEEVSRTSDGVFVKTDIIRSSRGGLYKKPLGTSFYLICTTKQQHQLLEMFGGE